jgi:hypothetical protein
MKRQTIAQILTSAAIALLLCGTKLLAQDDNGGGPGGPPPGGDFDPAKFEQRMMENIRTNLNVTNDDEWSAIQPLVQKVVQARRDAGRGMGMMMGMGLGGPPPGGGSGPPADNTQGGSDNRPRRFGPPMSEEQQALQKALNGSASQQQVKEALAKYRAVRKDKQIKLEAAQADLQSVLTPRQEAEAVVMGLLP